MRIRRFLLAAITAVLLMFLGSEFFGRPVSTSSWLKEPVSESSPTTPLIGEWSPDLEQTHRIRASEIASILGLSEDAANQILTDFEPEEWQKRLIQGLADRQQRIVSISQGESKILVEIREPGSRPQTVEFFLLPKARIIQGDLPGGGTVWFEYLENGNMLAAPAYYHEASPETALLPPMKIFYRRIR